MSVAVIPSFRVLGPEVIATSTGESSACRLIEVEWFLVTLHAEEVLTRQSLEREFLDLAETWISDHGYTSSLTELVLNPAYQRIISLGPRVVPLILRELECRPDHWFWALTVITRANPVKPEDRGNLKKMSDTWLQWGREQGYRW